MLQRGETQDNQLVSHHTSSSTLPWASKSQRFDQICNISHTFNLRSQIVAHCKQQHDVEQFGMITFLSLIYNRQRRDFFIEGVLLLKLDEKEELMKTSMFLYPRMNDSDKIRPHGPMRDFLDLSYRIVSIHFEWIKKVKN